MRAPWPVLGAGLLVTAGVLHLVLLPAHLGEARGLGVYFCLIGAAQVAWGLLYVVRPTEWTRRVGVSILGVSPVALFILTRILRAPWSEGPEALDFIGAATVILEVLGSIALFTRGATPLAAPSAKAGKAVALAAVLILAGVAIGAASYGAGLVGEATIPWLGEREAEHAGHEAATPSQAGNSTHQHGEVP